ncbi:hypothetical protein [Cryobacterium arcticum]|uniref:hypothetical protein n=1 Tax=Cryobacterium arcticum TaxID=670052 RepID=UPI0011B5EF9F|nr:hypothetical protein [Cryobacterium arcticum]
MIATGAFGVVLMLSGCAGQSADAPAATPTVSATSTATAATATPTPSATSTPTPTADAVNLDTPESWLIGFTSVGPLNLGDQISSASQAMTAFTGTTYDGCPSVVSYDRPASPTILIPDRLGTGVVEQVVLQGGPDPVALAAGSPHTIEGIGIGSTLDAVTSAYPALTYQDDKYTPHYAVTDGNGNWINISVTDDIVTGIVVRASTVVATEYCS